MYCANVMEMLDAWIDHELPAGLADQITRHIELCQRCRKEADGLCRLSKSLNALPPINTPARLTKITLKAFRSGHDRIGFVEWWQSLDFSMRGFACGMAMAGLLVGIVLGISIPSYKTDTAANTYLASIYPVEGILP